MTATSGGNNNNKTPTTITATSKKTRITLKIPGMQPKMQLQRALRQKQLQQQGIHTNTYTPRHTHSSPTHANKPTKIHPCNADITPTTKVQKKSAQTKTTITKMKTCKNCNEN